MNTITPKELKLDKKGQGYAKIYSSLLKDEFQRKRAYACLSALYAFLDFIESNPRSFTVQKSMTLFRNPALNEEFEITDLYINGIYIDFRVYVDGNAVLLPKVHVDNGILPDYYAVVKTDKNLSSFTLQGFLETADMKTESFDYYYNSASLSQLISYEDFVTKIEKAEPPVFDASEHNLLPEEYLRLTDNEIDKDVKRELVKHMLECEDCRREFCCFTGFEMVSINTGKYPELTEDKTLDIIAAQAVEKGEYQGKEETICISDDSDVAEVETLVSDNSKEDTAQNDISNIDNISNDYEIIEDTTLNDSHLPVENIVEATEGVTGVAAAATGIAAVAAAGSALAGAEEISSGSEIIENVDDTDILDADVNDILFPASDNNDIVLDTLSEDNITEVQENVPDIIADNDSLSETNIAEDAPEPDILDELFTIDETLPDNQNVELNEDIQTQPEKIFEDVSGETSELILKSDEENDVVQNNAVAQDSDVQQVIIDYNDNGDPVYSYVTTISDDNVDTESNDDLNISDEEEDNLLLDDLDSEETLTTIEDNSEEVYLSDNDSEETDELTIDDFSNNDELVSEDEEPEIFGNEDEENNSGVSSVLTAASISAGAAGVASARAASNDADTDVSDDNLLSVDDFLADDENSDSHSSESMYDSQVENFVNDNDDDDVSFDESESDEEDDGNEYDEDDEYDEDGEYDEDSEDEEYDEDDEAGSLDFIEENQTPGKKSGSAIAVVLLILLLLLGGGGFGAYYFFNQNKSTVAVNKPAQNDVNTSVTVPDVNIGEQSDNVMPPIEGTSDILPPEEQQNQQPEQQQEQQQEQPQNNDYQAPPLTEHDLVPENAPLTQDPNKAITGAFSSNVPLVSLNGMNWKFKPELFSNSSFKDFLRNIDNNLKEKLKSNLMNASESPQNRAVSASIVVNNAGELVRSSINASSGSQQIDNIVLQSIKECFDGEKTVVIPEGTTAADKYNLVVVIKL